MTEMNPSSLLALESEKISSSVILFDSKYKDSKPDPEFKGWENSTISTKSKKSSYSRSKLKPKLKCSEIISPIKYSSNIKITIKSKKNKIHESQNICKTSNICLDEHKTVNENQKIFEKKFKFPSIKQKKIISGQSFKSKLEGKLSWISEVLEKLNFGDKIKKLNRTPDLLPKRLCKSFSKRKNIKSLDFSAINGLTTDLYKAIVLNKEFRQ